MISIHNLSVTLQHVFHQDSCADFVFKVFLCLKENRGQSNAFLSFNANFVSEMKSKISVQTTKRMDAIYEESSIAEKIVRKFDRFKSEHFHFET